MPQAQRTTFAPAEAREIRSLLDALPAARQAERRMSTSRLRHLGVPRAARASRATFDALVEAGELAVAEGPGASRAQITPHPGGRVFRVAVGVTGDSIPETWSAFDKRYQWLGKEPKSIASGDHLFVLAVDRWKSAVVGLYETVSGGAETLPGSPDPERWPWALGVKPLAAIPPPNAVQVIHQRGPQSGLPERVDDDEAVRQLYTAVADSPPPPGPTDLEQRVQELEVEDVTEDVLTAVRELGDQAYQPQVIKKAVELGRWNDAELSARAWFTGTGEESHIRRLVARALSHEMNMSRTLERPYGSSPFTFREADRAGVPYRQAGDRSPTTHDERVASIDIAELERATQRHMRLQDRFADELQRRGIEPRSPGPAEPQFDLAFEHRGAIHVVEVKTGTLPSQPQVRIGVGQVLEYHALVGDMYSTPVRPMLLLEGEPPAPWPQLAERLAIQIVRADRLDESLNELLNVA